MNNGWTVKPTICFWIIKFPNRASLLSDVLIPSSPYHLAASIEFGEIKLGDIHSFQSDEESAMQVATDLLKSSVTYHLGIAEDI